MTHRMIVLLAATMTAGLAGCEPVDYYPTHETTQRSTDLQKSGGGTYGGNNSEYPVGTPGTPGTVPEGSPGASGAIPAQANPSAGPGFNTNGQGTFTPTGSYTGANTGGAVTNGQTGSNGDGNGSSTAGGH